MIKQAKEGKRSNQTIKANYDFVVLGGGLSGVCCAIEAARQGCKVALVQDRPVLGGNASSEVRVWALGATSHMGNNNRWAREGGVIGEIMVENLYRNREGNPLLFDVLLLDKVESEPNITLYLNTVAYDIKMENTNQITSVIAFNPQNQTEYILSAKFFCDASGDGVLAYLSGASYRMGAEEKEEFCEGFSPSEGYGQLLGHTIFLYTKKTDQDVKFVAPSFALTNMNCIPKLHQITPDQYGCNYWWFEYGGTKNTISDSENIKFELWRIVYGAWNHIKNSGLYPEASNLTLEWVGMIPGKRESRRFEGLYMLTQHDIVEQTHFPDAIAYGGWAIDLHPADGVYSASPSCNQYHSEGIYSIPYRCYVSKDINNLFLAGRIISASHVAFGSTRVMITSGFGGQAIGCAASLCCDMNCLPADLLEPSRMHLLQQKLALQGQSIPAVPIDCKDNLAAKGTFTTSSTLKFTGFNPDTSLWRRLDMSMGELLPLKRQTAYQISLLIHADEPTEIIVDLMTSAKPENYTPNKLIERVKLHLLAGEQKQTIQFSQTLPTDSYGFIILRRNPLIKVCMSNERCTGILSVFNKFNKAVNNFGCQTPPQGSGFKEFEFFTPERRPNGHNFAFQIHPALDCYNPSNLCNGYVRPYLSTNAWSASWADSHPTLTIDFGQKENISELFLYFDTDYDHPSETIQWGHPERIIPFCVQNYVITDEQGVELYKMKGNHQTINHICLEHPVTTRLLHIQMFQSHPLIPVSLFQLIVK